jgi:hypothetical protein
MTTEAASRHRAGGGLRFLFVAVLAGSSLPGCAGAHAGDPSGHRARDFRSASTPPATDPPLELTLETDRELYAPGDPVTLNLTLTNAGEEPVTLEFSDAQRFDLRILDAGGGLLWQWSDEHVFAQLLGEERVAPGDSLTWQATYEGRLSTGLYIAEGLVPARDRTLRADAGFRVR